jgi:protoporphyrinogen oxidase
MMRKYKSGGAKKAKSGTKAKMKAKSGSTLKKAPAGSKGKGMRSLPKAVRNKIGFAKKGKAVKKCKSGCK